VPFHRSITEAVAELVLLDPTAKHGFGLLAQATPPRVVSVGLPFGLATRLQVVPFQRAMNVWKVEPKSETTKPVVKQVVEVEHVTPINRVSSTPAGFGLGKTDHCVPFHNSISDVVVAPRSTSPTAKQRVAVLHATALSVGTVPLGMAGLVISDHAEPFHRSMMGADVGLVMDPTAKQRVPMHVTPCSMLTVEPTGFGLATTDHFVPFQCSTSVLIELLAPEKPTAKQLAVVGHETERSSL
jgi:hypothetical protein